MFLPAAHPTLEKIESIDLIKLLFKGEVATCYEYRNKVVMHINQAIDEVEDKSSLDEDLETIYQWFLAKNSARYWQSAQKEKSASEMADWILENAMSEVEAEKAEQSFTKAAGVPSESELEDAYNWVESSLSGSPAQIKWAKDIAHKHQNEICIMWKKGKEIPTSAKWWIDNRNGILQALGSL
jgi:DNA primase large subunit